VTAGAGAELPERPYSMTTYEVWIAAPKGEAFDWTTGREGGLVDLVLAVKVADGLDAMLALMRAIEEKRLVGRQLDWGSWIAPVSLARLRDVMATFGWPFTPELESLDPGRAYFLVAVET
jgi:hypothetical protein